MKVLIVDDSATIRISMQRLMRRIELEADAVDSGPAALAYLAEHNVDLVVTDLNMPRMNGIELIAEIRKLPNMRFKPIVVLSSESDRAKFREAKDAGALAWMVKPDNERDLINVVRHVMPMAVNAAAAAARMDPAGV